ncbi:MAG: substrate-binding domain-containing protein [Actinobacteria bacterium]|nr:substrate-binding domain-containing protein [Actinomycetota bacterium]
MLSRFTGRKNKIIKIVKSGRAGLYTTLFISILVILLLGSFLSSCERNTEKKVLLGVTTSIYDSGLLSKLISVFEDRSEYIIIPIAVGTGEAITMGEKGLVDAIFVHSRQDEEKFIKEGFGIYRKDVMYNNFVLVGPENDPADIKNLDVIEAFKILAKKESLFISRGDNSGTNKKEMLIWKEAKIMPQGNWYVKSGQEMVLTLKIADEKKSYTLTDKATFITYSDSLSLKILAEGDNILFNPYGIIAVNPLKHEDININFKGASSFIEFITGKDGQEIIKDFGLKDYGQPLFYIYS